MDNINAITITLVLAFLLPLIIGAFKPFSMARVERSFGSLLGNIEFLTCLLMAVYMTNKIFFIQEPWIFRSAYSLLPKHIKDFFQEREALTYIIMVPLTLMLLLGLLRLITAPFYKHILLPVSRRIYRGVSTLSTGGRRMVGVLWQIPKALIIPLVLTMLLTLFSYYFYAPALSHWMDTSLPYQFLYRNAVNPLVQSNLARKIPVLVNDSFGEVFGKIIPKETGSIIERLSEKLTGGNIRVIEYFNGVTLDEAVKSTPEIDRTAVSLAEKEQNSIRKAYKLYQWISKNIEYDYEKAEKIVSNASDVSSGSIVAFSQKKGICFDYSCLYISMCRAVGLKVRLVTGLGYSGTSWGDHAWNEVYIEEEERWVSLDATFGSSGVNYFDKPDFEADHRYAEIQEEW